MIENKHHHIKVTKKLPALYCLSYVNKYPQTNYLIGVNKYLKDKNITRISVAHRQETIQSADRVIDLEALIKKQPMAQAI